MPNIKSAKKRMRTSEEDRIKNRAVKTRIKNVRRTLLEATADATASASKDVYTTYCSVLDKAAKKGTISKNTAIRRKRRAAVRMKKGSEKTAGA